MPDLNKRKIVDESNEHATNIFVRVHLTKNLRRRE